MPIQMSFSLPRHANLGSRSSHEDFELQSASILTSLQRLICEGLGKIEVGDELTKNYRFMLSIFHDLSTFTYDIVLNVIYNFYSISDLTRIFYPIN